MVVASVSINQGEASLTHRSRVDPSSPLNSASCSFDNLILVLFGQGTIQLLFSQIHGNSSSTASALRSCRRARRRLAHETIMQRGRNIRKSGSRDAYNLLSTSAEFLLPNAMQFAIAHSTSSVRPGSGT